MPASVSARASSPSASVAVASQEPLPDGGPYVRGRTWKNCHFGFRATSTPARDLIRLSMLCGPYHGMRALGPAVEGTWAAGNQPRKETFPCKKDQCFRWFAVGDEAVRGLSLRVRAPGGELLGEATANARWIAMPDDGALCVQATGECSYELSVTEGAGAYAVQPWILP